MLRLPTSQNPRPSHQKGTTWIPETIDLYENRLVWSALRGKEVTVPPNLLAQFVALEDATDDRILAFARRAGVLAFCKHQLPASHLSVYGGFSFGVKPCEILAESPLVETRYDRLIDWRNYARKTASAWRIGTALKSGERGEMRDWCNLMIPVEGSFPWKARVAIAQQEFARIMKSFLSDAHIRPELTWSGAAQTWEIVFSSTSFQSITGIVAERLILSLADSDAYAICRYGLHGPHMFMPGNRSVDPAVRRCCGDPACRRKRDRELKREQRARKA